MDKFGGTRKTRVQKRRFVTGAGVFLVVASCFVPMFVFGNTAGPWVLGVLIFGTILAAWNGFKNAKREYAILLQSLRWLPGEAEGFSPLEVAALHELLRHDQSEALEAWLGYMEDAEVVERYNSGGGCVVCIRSTQPVPKAGLSLKRQVWFGVTAAQVVTGAHLWFVDEDDVLVLEFFCGQEDTRHWHWTHEVFGPVPENAQRPSVPAQRPFALEPSMKRFYLS